MVELNISNELTFGFQKYNIPFTSIGKYIKKYCYSACSFKSGHRNKENIESLGNLLIYDFDDGAVTVDEMRKYLENNKLTSAIFTTKSHRIEKNGKPAVDRYRLFIPFSRNIEVSVYDYSDFFMYVAKLLNIDDLIDTACKNPSRSFYPNPKQEEYYIDGGRIFDTDFLQNNFKKYSEKNIDKKTPIKNTPKKEIRHAGEVKENEVSPDKEVIVYGKRMRLGDFTYLNQNETVQCRCISPYHEDKNPSAFIGRSNKSGSLMVKCSSCGAVYFMK